MAFIDTLFMLYLFRRRLFGLMIGSTKFCNAVPCNRVIRTPLEVEYVTDDSAFANSEFKFNLLFISGLASSSKFSI